LWIAVELHLSGTDDRKLAGLARLGKSLDVPLVASGDVHMHVRERRTLQDAVTAIRLNVPVKEAGLRLHPNGERHLRELQRLARLYPPQLLAETLHIAERCTFSLGELRYEYPHEIVPEGETPETYLRKLTEEGAAWRWPEGVPPGVQQTLKDELALIRELDYESYFLTVHDIVREARAAAPRRIPPCATAWASPP
jgi:error-prone DNA polymerase